MTLSSTDSSKVPRATLNECVCAGSVSTLCTARWSCARCSAARKSKPLITSNDRCKWCLSSVPHLLHASPPKIGSQLSHYLRQLTAWHLANPTASVPLQAVLRCFYPAWQGRHAAKYNRAWHTRTSAGAAISGAYGVAGAIRRMSTVGDGGGWCAVILCRGAHPPTTCWRASARPRGVHVAPPPPDSPTRALQPQALAGWSIPAPWPIPVRLRGPSRTSY